MPRFFSPPRRQNSSSLIVRSIIGFLIACATCSPAFAQSRVWGEIGVSPALRGVHAQIKYVNGNSGWTASFLRADQYQLFGTLVDNATQENAQPSVQVLSVLRTISLSNRWAHMDIGAGLGYANGKWGQNCVTQTPVPFQLFEIENCDVEDIGDVGIPIQASISLGRYIGLGAAVTGFISEPVSFANLTFFIPFGQYPK